MKSFLLTSCFTFCIAYSLVSQTENGIPLPSRATTERGIPSSATLTNDSRSTFFYNLDSTINFRLDEIWNESFNSWRPSNRYFYYYGTDSRLVELVWQFIDPTDTWHNYNRTLYTYYLDTTYLNGQAKIEELQLWNGIDSTGDWIIGYIRNRYAWEAGTGDLEGELYKITVKGFTNNMEQVWGDVTEFDKISISAGIRLLGTTYASYNPSLGTDEPIYREEYIYNSPTSLQYDTINKYSWIQTDMNWSVLPEQRTIQSNTAMNQIQLHQSFMNNQWLNNFRSTLVYNTFNQLEVDKTETWDEAITAFREDSRIEIDYNADHSRDKARIYYKDFDLPGLYLSQNTTYEYGPVSGTQTPDLRAEVVAFPNPSLDYVQISLNNDSGKHTNCTLINAKGIISSQIQTTGNTVMFSLVGQPAGTYFLQVEQNGATKVIPVVKN